jgi:ribosomal protein S18 acetylase RimI-like enzyme
VHDVFAWVTDENRNAMRFYERLGFGPAGERRRIPAHPEEYETLLVRRVSDHVT